jgi:hypothetical protein
MNQRQKRKREVSSRAFVETIEEEEIIIRRRELRRN